MHPSQYKSQFHFIWWGFGKGSRFKYKGCPSILYPSFYARKGIQNINRKHSYRIMHLSDLCAHYVQNSSNFVGISLAEVNVSVAGALHWLIHWYYCNKPPVLVRYINLNEHVLFYEQHCSTKYAWGQTDWSFAFFWSSSIVCFNSSGLLNCTDLLQEIWWSDRPLMGSFAFGKLVQKSFRDSNTN